MSKFSYEPGELRVGRSQCDLCRNQLKGKNGCSVYFEIPEYVITGKFLCEKFKSDRKPYPWEEDCKE